MDQITVDYLILGSGIAGLWFAYKLKEKGNVLIVTKKESPESNTNYAQGGIAAAVAEDDNPQIHYEDTIRAGAGLAHKDIVKLVTESGPRLVRELWALGIKFSATVDVKGEPQFDLGQEGGHRRRRIVHAQDATGFEIERGLLQVVSSQPNVKIWEEHFAVDIVLNENGEYWGVIVLNKSTKEMVLVHSRVCLLATGGIGQVYLHTTNPMIATGDGIAMAFRAGAKIANMEFIQFHPTTLYGRKIDDRAFLISEAVRGEGAILRTRDGKPFMNAYHPDGSLAPRDVVARAIAAEITRRGEEFVLLDCSPIPPKRLKERFPNIYKTCLDLGIDITREPIPVVPAAHYVCGGVLVNSWGESTIKGLFAAGECACTGLHGANRLASNSLLEALVFAERAAIAAQENVGQTFRFAKSKGKSQKPKEFGIRNSEFPHFAFALPHLPRRLREIMWRYAGIVRSDAGLKEAAAELSVLSSQSQVSSACEIHSLELRNLLFTARLIVACAQRRLESRGLHYNQDHPLPDERFEKDTIISKTDLEI